MLDKQDALEQQLAASCARRDQIQEDFNAFQRDYDDLLTKLESAQDQVRLSVVPLWYHNRVIMVYCLGTSC